MCSKLTVKTRVNRLCSITELCHHLPAKHVNYQSLFCKRFKSEVKNVTSYLNHKVSRRIDYI